MRPQRSGRLAFVAPGSSMLTLKPEFLQFENRHAVSDTIESLRVENRNDVVKKFNKLAGDYKELADKWNTQQAEIAAKNATNAPAKK